MCDIGELHNKFSQSLYDDFLSTTINKWKSDIEFKCFVEYWQEKNTVLPLCITQFTEPLFKLQFNVIYLIVA